MNSRVWWSLACVAAAGASMAGCEAMGPRASEPALRKLDAITVDRGMRRLDFLRGSWCGLDEDGLSEEVWTAPVGDTMMGMFRLVTPDGAPAVLELMSIAAEPARMTAVDSHPPVVMRLRHFDARMQSREREPIVLHLTHLAGRLAEFKRVSGSDTLDTIAYEGDQRGRLVVTVGFTPESGRPPMRFEFRRTGRVE